jgi:predicted peptidase
MDVFDWVKRNYPCDTTRVYVLGMSLGGYGTMDVCGTYPDRIAAGMALCGGTTLKDVSGLGELPFWIIHGTADRAQEEKPAGVKGQLGINHITEGEAACAYHHQHSS